MNDLVFYYSLLLLSFVLLRNVLSEDCSGSVCLQFKTYEMPYLLSQELVGNDTTMLQLSSAGMRRKNLFVVDVDVYSVGLYLSPEKQVKLKSNPTGKLIEALVSGDVDDAIHLCLVLKFVRDVKSSLVVDAIASALSSKGDSYSHALSSFKSILLKSLGAGASKGDSIHFYSKSNSSIGIASKNVFGDWIENKELHDRLIAIYLGSASVAPELVDNLKSQYKQYD